MSSIHIILDGEGAWPDLPQREVIHLTDAWQIAALGRGMKSGHPSIAIRLNLPDGKVVIAETSLKMLVAAVHAFIAKYGDPTAESEPERVACPQCGHVGVGADVKNVRPGWISVGFKCPNCGHIWGHELPPDEEIK